MTLETNETAEGLAKMCAIMVKINNEENELDLSDNFVEIWNRAIKLVTPLKFCKMICDELENTK